MALCAPVFGGDAFCYPDGALECDPRRDTWETIRRLRMPDGTSPAESGPLPTRPSTGALYGASFPDSTYLARVAGLDGALRSVHAARMAADEVVRAMFFLPVGMDLDLHSHVVLTSQGTVVAHREEPKLLDPAGGAVFVAGRRRASLYGGSPNASIWSPWTKSTAWRSGKCRLSPRSCSSCGPRTATAKRGPSSPRNLQGNITNYSRRSGSSTSGGAARARIT